MTELITKIKIENDLTAIIEFKKTTDLNTSEIVYIGKEKVIDDFFKKFQQAKESFLEIIPALKNDKTNITMNVIKLDYENKDKISKVSYSVKYKPQKNVITNIPVNSIPIYKEAFSDKQFSVSGKDEALLYDLVELAKKYMAGETNTEQQKLDLQIT